MRTLRGLHQSILAVVWCLTSLSLVQGFATPSSSLQASSQFPSQLGQPTQSDSSQRTNGLAFVTHSQFNLQGVGRITSLHERASGGGGEDEPKRKRRRRKDGKNIASIEKEGSSTMETESSPSSLSPSPIQETEAVTPSSPSVSNVPPPPSSLEIMDVRDVVSGKTSPSPNAATANDKSILKDVEVDDDDEDDDEEYEYYYEDEDGNEVVVGTESSISSSSDSSLEKLLADARQMRQQEAGLGEDASGGQEVEETLKSKIKNVLSTIVTADFFVVCALLAWFLAGIFCSYVIKDDTVQIAFNGIFEPVVQPALGVLMLGSALGSVFEESSEED